jgi:hypothetical protein
VANRAVPAGDAGHRRQTLPPDAGLKHWNTELR